MLATSRRCSRSPSGDGFVREPGEASTECVAENDTVCIGWAIDNIDRYVTPTLEHLVLVVVLGRRRLR